MLKPLVPKRCLHLSARLKDIAEKQVPAKLKPIVAHIRSKMHLSLHLLDGPGGVTPLGVK